MTQPQPYCCKQAGRKKQLLKIQTLEAASLTNRNARLLIRLNLNLTQIVLVFPLIAHTVFFLADLTNSNIRAFHRA